MDRRNKPVAQFADHTPHRALRPRRVNVCGGTRISPENAEFCKRLGWELAAEQGLTIITGGFQHVAGEPDQPSADWSTVQGALARLSKDGVRPADRIETLLVERDWDKAVRFKEGKVRVLRNRSLQARRFVLVNSADAVVAVHGRGGTREMIDLALALERPCLPLPFTKGASAERWQENRPLIQEWFDLKDSAAARLEAVDLGTISPQSARRLAKRISRLLQHQLKHKCFVMMPFNDEYLPMYQQAIKPAVLEHDCEPIRADHLNLVGNAVGILRSAINACDCAIAVIVEYNANVMYELGFAHAQGKPAILIARQDPGTDQLGDLPFDLRTECVIRCRGDLAPLRKEISAALKQILGT